MLAHLLGYLNVVQGVVLKMYFVDENMLNFINANVSFLPIFLVIHALKIFLPFYNVSI